MLKAALVCVLLFASACGGSETSGPVASPGPVVSPGTPDAGTPDAGPLDAGLPDAGPPDAGPPDAGPPDAGLPDAGIPGAVQVGWVATFTSFEQGIAGTVIVTGADTLRVTGFKYTGGGLGDVRFYGGKGGLYYNGFAFGPQLAGRAWSGETLDLTLPTGRTLADLDGIAVWCVLAGVDFGDGRFHAP